MSRESGAGSPSWRRREIALLFGWNFAIVTAFFVGRTVRDVLFLAHESPARLPYLYILSPITVTAVGLAYGRFADRVRRDRLILATSLGAAALMIAARLALGPRWLYYALYVGVECVGALGMMQFWITAGERFSPRDAKRWFGVIAAGGTAANIVVGLALTGVVQRTGAENLLFVVAGALVAVAVAASLLARLPVAGRKAGRGRGRPPPAAERDTPGTSHLGVLAPMIACTVLAVTLLDFQFKAITTATYAADRVAMVQFFATLSAATGVASFLIQLTLTGRLLGRFGVAGALLLLPTTLSLGAVALLLVPSLAAATACKAADATLRYTVHDAGMQLLYLPVPSAVRTRKKAFLDGVVKPGSEAAVGAALLVYRTVAGALAPLAIAAIVVTAIWCGLVARMRGAYVRSLAETLRRRRVQAVGPDEERATAEVVAAARAAIAAGDRATVLRGLDLARLAPAALGTDIAPLARHADPAVRAAALDVLAAAGVEIADERLAGALASDDPDERIAAARAATGPQLARLEPLLDDAPPLAAAAAVSLLRRGDDAQRTRARERIAKLLEHAEPRARRAGMDAAAELGDGRWLEPLIRRLGDVHDAPRAVRALAAMGSSAEPRLAELATADDDRAAAGALRALGTIASPRATAVILGQLASPGELRRDAACAALATAARAGAALDVARVVDACRGELRFAFEAMAASAGLGREESTLQTDGTRTAVPFAPDSEEGPAALVSRALRERTERATMRLFTLLSAIDPELDVETVRLNLREPEASRRANAVELLDAHGWARAIAPLKPLVLALVDDSPRHRKLEVASARLELPRRTRDGWIEALLTDRSPWIVTSTAYFAGAAGAVAARERLDALARSPVRLVASTAREAIARLENPDREVAMLTTADKILFLKGIELFAQLPSEDLADIAVLTEEIAVERGERLFAEHDQGDALYLVVEGRMHIVRGSERVAELGVGEVLGELALLDSAPRSADAIAPEPARLLRVGRDDFANLLAERPEVAAGILRVLSRRLRAAL